MRLSLTSIVLLTWCGQFPSASTAKDYAGLQQLSGGNPGQMMLAKSAGLASAFELDTRIGVLTDDRSGIGFTERIGGHYAFPFYDPNPIYGINIDLYLGGVFGDDDAKLGTGNLAVEGKWLFWRGHGHALAASFELMLPIAQTEANVGLATADFIHYFEDAFGLSPALTYSWEYGWLLIAAHAGLDTLLLIEDSAAPPNTNDVAELFLDSRGGISMRLPKKFRANVEAAAISALTGEESHTEVWFAGGASWSAATFSLSGGVEIPIAGDSSDTLNPIFRLKWNYNL